MTYVNWLQSPGQWNSMSSLCSDAGNGAVFDQRIECKLIPPQNTPGTEW